MSVGRRLLSVRLDGGTTAMLFQLAWNGLALTLGNRIRDLTEGPGGRLFLWTDEGDVVVIDWPDSVA